jgi:histidine triad (HIT) family protein
VIVADCLFCKIAAKEIEGDIVFEDDDIVAFRDINPAAPTHILVIPRRHIASASDLDPGHGELLEKIFSTIASLASREGLDRGHRIVTNVGGDAGQSVQHLHFHLLGGRAMSWPPG